MNFSTFAKTAVEQDARNKFGKYDGELGFVPTEFQTFYRCFNPEDVEIRKTGGTIRFYPAGNLAELQKEYQYLKAQFIFATCNGDPIFFHDGQFYTCPHGVREPEWEKIDSVFELLQD